MKTIRSLMTLAGISLVLFALSATGAKAQILSSARFSGNFTLPVAAQWGRMALPAGEYTLSYGQPFKGGTFIVVVAGNADGNIRGMVLVKANVDASTTKDALVCIREGDALVVRALEMPELNTAAQFALPHGAKLVARNAKQKGYTQLAEAPMLIERIPVTLNAK
ncbi:MAG TPA: hypothetical protein VNM47_17395 [Terriglobia bacterium]|nr:hypothetical protein [Terriglobia bacterium]